MRLEDSRNEVHVGRPHDVGEDSSSLEGVHPDLLPGAELSAFGLELEDDHPALGMDENEIREADVALDVCRPAASHVHRREVMMNEVAEALRKVHETIF